MVAFMFGHFNVGLIVLGSFAYNIKEIFAINVCSFYDFLT